MRVGGNRVELDQTEVLETPRAWARLAGVAENPKAIRLENPIENSYEPIRRSSGPLQSGDTDLELKRVLSRAKLSLTFLREQLRSSEVSSLVAVAGLFREHESDLAAYLSTDAKGMLVPRFVEQLGTELTREQALLQEECERLAQSLEEIRGLIEDQRENRFSEIAAEYAKHSGAVCSQPAPSRRPNHEFRD